MENITAHGNRFDNLDTELLMVRSENQTMIGLLAHFICRFMFLGRSLIYASKYRSLATKVVVNQIVFAPLFSVYFFGMQSLLSGDDLKGAWERIKNAVPISFINSCKLWPVVTAFNFTYIRPESRALFAGQSSIMIHASC